MPVTLATREVVPVTSPIPLLRLKVVAPAFPADVKGLLAAAIRDPDPVLFFEQKSLYSMKGEVPDGEYVDELGKAKVLRRGHRIYEVPISYAGREPDEGKKITWRDGFSALAALVRFRFTKEY